MKSNNNVDREEGNKVPPFQGRARSPFRRDSFSGNVSATSGNLGANCPANSRRRAAHIHAWGIVKAKSGKTASRKGGRGTGR